MHCLCTSTQTYKAPFSFGEGVFLRPMFVLRHLCILYPQIIHTKKLQSKYSISVRENPSQSHILSFITKKYL